MGIFSKTIRILRAKTNSVLNRVRDPQEEIEYEYEQMREDVSQMEEALVDIEQQRQIHLGRKEELEEEIKELNGSAKTAVQQDKKELARKALKLKKEAMEELEEEEEKASELDNTKESMTEKLETLRQQMEDAKNKKETLKARHKSAEAQKNAAEALTSVGGGNEFEKAADQLEEEYKNKEARADSIEQLDEEGVLDNPSEKDELGELEDLKRSDDVDSELEQLMDEFGEEDEVVEDNVTEETTEKETETVEREDK